MVIALNNEKNNYKKVNKLCNLLIRDKSRL